jgi:hypothetical protein
MLVVFIYLYIMGVMLTPPVTVTERSKVCTVFARSEAGIVGWNPTHRIHV